jgi:hypothetical protein
VEHFFFYALEYRTGSKFVHGQPVCLGLYLGSAMHENTDLAASRAARLCPPAKEMLATLHRAGVDIRPEAMGVTWDQVAGTLYDLARFVTNSDLPYTVANEARITDAFIEQSRERIEAAFGPWVGPPT